MALTDNPTYAQYSAEMQKDTGRPGSQEEYNQFWKDRPDYRTGIYGSAEGQAYNPAKTTEATGGTGSTPDYSTDTGPQNGDYQGWFNSLIAGKPYNQQTLLDLEPTLNKYGIQLTPPNASGERTKIGLPGGQWVRVGFGEGHPVWIPQGAGSAGSAGSGGAGAGGAQSASSTWINTPSPSSFPEPAMPNAASRNPTWDAFYNQLLNRSNQSLAVNPNDPVIKAQTEAYRNEQTRGSRQNLAAIAESAGPNTNIGAETRHAGELVSQNTAGFQAQLMGREVDARRQEIAQALAGMAGQLTTEESSRLRQEDQALQGRQLQLGTQLSSAQLALQNELGRQGASQAQWLQAFQDRGWGADQAQRAWDDQYKAMFG